MTTNVNVGLMVPSNNTTLEQEVLRWMPENSTCKTIRIPRGSGLLTTDTLPAYIAQAIRLATQFADSTIDVVAYGCTAAGFISGPTGDSRLASDLSHITRKPVVTTARSMVVALHEIEARTIALITPYSDAVNDSLKAFLADSAISVNRFSSFYATSVEELGKIRSDEVANLARRTMSRDCDAIFIACAQLPTYDIIDTLEEEFGCPVWSSNRAISAQALHVMGRSSA